MRFDSAVSRCRLQPQLAPFWSSTQQLLYASTLRTVWALRPPGSDSKPPLSRPWIVALSVGGGVLIACAALAFWQVFVCVAFAVRDFR